MKQNTTMVLVTIALAVSLANTAILWEHRAERRALQTGASNIFSVFSEAISGAGPHPAPARVTEHLIDKTREVARAKEPTAPAAILVPKVRFMKFAKGEYRDSIRLGVDWDTSGLKMPTRAIKGVMVIGDIFGTAKIRVGMTITDTLKPGEKFQQLGLGFDYNPFIPAHRWAKETKIDDMTFRFDVKEVMYVDADKKAGKDRKAKASTPGQG